MTEEHKAIVRENGQKGGCPPGTQNPDKKVLRTPAEREKFIEKLAQHWLEKGGPVGFQKNPMLQAASDRDLKAVSRFFGMSVDAINERFSSRLADYIDALMDEAMVQLKAGNFKPADLNMGMAIGIDKRTALDGRAALANANVTQTINVFGAGMTREQIIASLKEAKTVEPTVIDVGEPKP